MQGGGAYITGSASFINCNLFDNEANHVRARILNLLEPSSSAPLNSDTLRCFDTQGFGVRARFRTLCSLLPAPRWNVTRLIAYFCMQGGGAYIRGSASFINCNLFGNEANAVRARVLNLLGPSSIAPLEPYATDCIRMHAGRRGLH